MSFWLKSVSVAVCTIGFVFTCGSSNAQNSSGGQGSSSKCYHYDTVVCPTPAANQPKCSDTACSEVISYEGGGSGGQPLTKVTRYFCRQSQVVTQINGEWDVAVQSILGEPREGNSTIPRTNFPPIYCLQTQGCNFNQECGPSGLCSSVGHASGSGTAHVDAVIFGQCP